MKSKIKKVRERTNMMRKWKTSRLSLILIVSSSSRLRLRRSMRKCGRRKRIIIQ